MDASIHDDDGEFIMKPIKIKFRMPILFTKSRPFKVKAKVLHRKMKYRETLCQE